MFVFQTTPGPVLTSRCHPCPAARDALLGRTEETVQSFEMKAPAAKYLVVVEKGACSLRGPGGATHNKCFRRLYGDVLMNSFFDRGEPPR